MQSSYKKQKREKDTKKKIVEDDLRGKNRSIKFKRFVIDGLICSNHFQFETIFLFDALLVINQ